ncbi:hypothetical protein QA596_01775 [Balneolales bacterium ANBcel1]|nr:hypothetical protein [Balneolales bacterium ANBcel1]
MFLVSCDLSDLNDAFDDFGVIVQLDAIETTNSILLLDSSTGQLITEELEIQFTGPNADDVIDMYSDPVSSARVRSGILNLNLSNDLSPTDDDPAVVTLVLRNPNYLTTTRTVTINETGFGSNVIRVMRRDAEVSGVYSAVDNSGVSDAQGSVSTPIGVQSSDNPDEAYAARFSVSEGTVIADASGNPLTGQISTELTYFSPDDPDALNALPIDNLTLNGDILVSAGLVTLSMRDQNNREAATLSGDDGGALLELTIDDNFEHPGSGEPLRAGDELIIAVLNEQNEIAGYETITIGEAAGKQKANKQPGYESAGLPISVPRIIFSGFSGPTGITPLGNMLIVVTAASIPTTMQVGINRNGNTGSILVNLRRTGFNRDVTIPAGNSSHTVPRIPCGTYTYTAELPGGTVIGTFNPCDNSSINITLPPPPANLIDANVNVTLQCRNAGDKLRVTDIPGSSVSFRKADGSGSWRTTRPTWNFDEDNNELIGGSALVAGVESGEDYTFSINYDDDQYTSTINMSGISVEHTEIIDDDVCN